MRRIRIPRLLLLLLCLSALIPTASSQSGEQRHRRQPSHLYQISAWDEKTGDRKVGFIDSMGRLVIGFDRLPKTMKDVGEFHNGRARIYLKREEAGKAEGAVSAATGYIDETGAMVIAPRFRFAYDFSEGLARVYEEGFAGFIDVEGKPVIKINGTAQDFHEEMAVTTPRGRSLSGYIDRSGRMVIKPQYEFADNFSEGLAGVRIDRKYGFINKQGEMVIPPRFELQRESRHPQNVISSGRFSEGLACVRVGEWYGSIDKRGEFMIPPQFRTAEDFSQGLAWVAMKDGSKRGWINRSGEWVITKVSGKGFSVDFSTYSHSDELLDWKYSEGLVAFFIYKGDRSLWGYINQRGEVVIEPRELIDAGPFVGGVARVTFFDKPSSGLGEAYGYIDKTGRLIWRSK